MNLDHPAPATPQQAEDLRVLRYEGVHDHIRSFAAFSAALSRRWLEFDTLPGARYGSRHSSAGRLS
ncbi:hypothetical protein OG948_57635 (plasmid) [Embleya sp. NBC_00888]|uniref:hypothetical protein n=1 Tax=Embleya sp. NBC_00888 TaxID=2975960 RepID=UPI002F9120B0|nr:hypothetical protein OG948_57635 [Embleya sp. NBC_00888]